MRATITSFLFLCTISLYGQVNDVNAFFNGSYDKVFISKQKIKQITVNIYINRFRSSQSIFDFDRDGFLRTQTVFDSSGKRVNDYIFIYNKYGDQTKIKNIAYNLNKTCTVTFKRIYKDSFLVQEKSNELPYITKHVYNVKGQKTQSVTFLETDTDFSAKRVFHYTYDTKGRLISIKETVVNNDGSISSDTGNTEYTYDATGNIITVFRPGKANYELSYEKGLLKSEKTKLPEVLGGIEMADEYSYTIWE